MDEAFGTTGKTLRSDLVRAAVVGLGVAVAFTGAQAFPENPPCPTRELAPLGLAPVPNQCATADCLVLFKGYKWWTSYAYNKVEFFTNYGLGTPFAPNHVFIDGSSQNMVLKADNDINLGGGNIWSGAEAVLMFDQNNNEANLGYGNYLVTAKLTMPGSSSFDALDPNVAFGVFTYERLGPFPYEKKTGTPENPQRELDLAEISRWGHAAGTTCTIRGRDGKFDTSRLCLGDAQFALQLVPQGGDPMVQRYCISGDVRVAPNCTVTTNPEITLVMRWHGANQQVTFEEYTGAYTFAQLGSQHPAPHYTWETPTNSPNLNMYVPATGCQRFHINLWFGNYGTGQLLHPAPSSPQEVVIENFEFQPM